MLVRFLRYLKGYVEIYIYGESTERVINLCRNKEIYIRALTPKDGGYICYLDAKSVKKLKPILRKTRTKLKITGRYGMPFFIQRYRKRKIFLLGMLASLCIIYFLSLHVWSIRIEGNVRITTENLLEYLQAEHIYQGMYKKEIVCSEIVKKIRKQYDQIIWASASLDGSRLLIQVKEGIALENSTEHTGTQACDIVADKDGIIVKIITRSGTPKVKKGDVVKQGDILVSGAVEVLNDAKEVTRYQYKVSDADILACVEERYKDSLSLFYEKEEYTGKKRYLPYIKTKNYAIRFGLYPPKYKKKICITKEADIRLGKDYILPIAYGITEIKEFKARKTKYTKEEVQKLLSLKYNAYIKEKESAGMTLKKSDVSIKITGSTAVSEGNLQIWQDIGKQMPVKIDFQENPVVE